MIVIFSLQIYVWYGLNYTLNLNIVIVIDSHWNVRLALLNDKITMLFWASSGYEIDLFTSK